MSLPLFTGESGFDRLPPEVIAGIAAYSDLDTNIHLGQVNHASAHGCRMLSPETCFRIVEEAGEPLDPAKIEVFKSRRPDVFGPVPLPVSTRELFGQICNISDFINVDIREDLDREYEMLTGESLKKVVPRRRWALRNITRLFSRANREEPRALRASDPIAGGLRGDFSESQMAQLKKKFSSVESFDFHQIRDYLLAQEILIQNGEIKHARRLCGAGFAYIPTTAFLHHRQFVDARLVYCQGVAKPVREDSLTDDLDSRLDRLFPADAGMNELRNAAKLLHLGENRLALIEISDAFNKINRRVLSTPSNSLRGDGLTRYCFYSFGMEMSVDAAIGLGSAELATQLLDSWSAWALPLHAKAIERRRAAVERLT